MIQRIFFLKVEGCGNDFIVLEDIGLSPDSWQILSRKMCDRHFGIGSDGLMLLPSNPNPETKIPVRMFNPDGSDMGMCGNGIRCICRYLCVKEFVATSEFTLHFDVMGREIICSSDDQAHNVRVNMGAPSFRPEDLPIRTDKPATDFNLALGERNFRCSALSMGNPHCVIPVDSFDDLSIESLGPMIENHPLFPKRTNVEFVVVKAPDYLILRVWERGAGQTLACGSGACASLVAMNTLGFCKGTAQIELLGGKVLVEWGGEDKEVFLTGPANEVFEGFYNFETFK